METSHDSRYFEVNKLPTEPTSFTPISLFSTIFKIFEKFVLPDVTPHILLSATQHSFILKYSSNTFLMMTQTIFESLNAAEPALEQN